MRRLFATACAVIGGVSMLTAVGWVAIAGMIMGEGVARPGRRK